MANARLNWGAFDHASHAPQLRSCNYYISSLYCVCVYIYTWYSQNDAGIDYRAFSRDVTCTKLIKSGLHFGVQHRFLEKLACLSMEPRSYIEALGAELVGKEDKWTN